MFEAFPFTDLTSRDALSELHNMYYSSDTVVHLNSAQLLCTVLENMAISPASKES